MVCWGKPFTCLVSRLALAPNRPKRAFTRASSPRSTIGCVQNDSWAYGIFGANRAPVLHLHKHHLQIDWNEIRHDPRHLGVPSGASKMVSVPMVRSALTVHQSYTNTNTISKQTEMDLSWVKISAISKRTKMRFYLSLVIYEYHLVRPKCFLSQWYIWRKLCIYLAPTLTLSPNG
jgi:hypothetical protein